MWSPTLRKISKEDRRELKQQLQLGFVQAWMAESRARKEKQSSEVREAKGSALRWLTFWKRPVPSVKPARAVGHANTGTGR